MGKRHPQLPNSIIFEVCERLLDGVGATRISAWVRSQGFSCTREQVYSILSQAIRLGYLRLCPPVEARLSQELREKYPHVPISVVNVEGREALDNVAEEGAELVIRLIQHRPRNKDAIHIGLGGGETTKRFSRRFGQRLRSEHNLPTLVFHALSSGFAARDPTTAPVSFFSFFSEVNTPVEYVGLFAEAVVFCDQYERTKNLPGVRESFEEAGNIDIIVTSLAARIDEDSLLNKFMELARDKGEGMRKLTEAGWVGDVLWQPYSAKGPIIVDTGIRAVILFQLEELVRFSAEPNKHVLLLAGPCAYCHKTKTQALRPLLEEPGLRVCNHIITDLTTARELLAKE